MTEPTATPLLVLRPGDNVLLTVVEELDPEETKDMAGKLREAFPGVEFTIVTGISSVLVQPPTEEKRYGWQAQGPPAAQTACVPGWQQEGQDERREGRTQVARHREDGKR